MSAPGNRMVSAFDLSLTTPEWALGYQFDIVLRGAGRNADGTLPWHLTPFQTVGPYCTSDCAQDSSRRPPPPGDRVMIRGRLLDGAGSGIPDGILEWWHPGFRRCIDR